MFGMLRTDDNGTEVTSQYTTRDLAVDMLYRVHGIATDQGLKPTKIHKVGIGSLAYSYRINNQLVLVSVSRIVG